MNENHDNTVSTPGMMNQHHYTRDDEPQHHHTTGNPVTMTPTSMLAMMATPSIGGVLLIYGLCVLTTTAPR